MLQGKLFVAKGNYEYLCPRSWNGLRATRNRRYFWILLGTGCGHLISNGSTFNKVRLVNVMAVVRLPD
jgi:hypothetical protein